MLPSSFFLLPGSLKKADGRDMMVVARRGAAQLLQKNQACVLCEKFTFNTC